jgi:hypothetical protein
VSSSSQILSLQLKRANDEIKLYVSNKQEDKKKSFREQLLKQISEQVLQFIKIFFFQFFH